eukprot:360284-Chlamydomonas_euryale.AAC.1
MDMDGGSQMGTLNVNHSHVLRRIAGVNLKLTDRHKLETKPELSLLELMVHRRTLLWMGHVL